MNPRSVFLFPAQLDLVHRVREALIEALDHDVTYSSAVNTALSYGFAAMRGEPLDRDQLRSLLRQIDIFKAEPELDRVLDVLEQELPTRVQRALEKTAGAQA